MKPFNIILSLILVLILAFGAFFYAGGTLQADVSSITASAADYPDAFESIRNVLQSGTAPQLFSNDPLDGPENYSLVDINISLANRGIFDAEWLNIQLGGVTGDIAVYSLTGDGSDVLSRSGAQANLKLITRAPADVKREITIQYYVYGVSRTVTVVA
ncbi:MAG: hypothetical protein IJ466_03620 [Clostridia bacterium]|nr:hypothetical protein [Clostridia bacterium]